MKRLIAVLILACTAAPVLAQVNSLLHKDVKRRYLVYTPRRTRRSRRKPFRWCSTSTAAA